MRKHWGFLLIVVSAVCAGWVFRGWYEAKLTLAVKQSAEQTRRTVEEAGRKSAEVLETRLQELRANEIHTEKITHTETIKPVFSNICATDEYVRLFNQSADRVERTLSGKPADTLSDKPAQAGR